MRHDAKDKRPLIVVLSKYDAWKALAPDIELRKEWIFRELKQGLNLLNVRQLQSVSKKLRELLQQHSPEIVSISEAFSEDVIYIPVSALGCSPREIPDAPPIGDPPRRPLGVLAGEISPEWAEVPLLYAMHKTMPGIVGRSLEIPGKQTS